MSVPILSTKLYIPPPRPDVVVRSGLLDRLDDGLRAGARLTVLSAPAGFGKTTLITSWIYDADRATASRSVAWLSLDQDDSDPTRFFAHFIAALRQIDPGIGRTALSLLGTPQALDTGGLMASLVMELAEVSDPWLLVLDDYHTVSAPGVHAALSHLLTQSLASMHIVIATRESPELPLPRMRVRGEVSELDATDLRFSEAETASYLKRLVSMPVTEDVATAVFARTEGWAAGIHLLALVLRRSAARGDESPADVLHRLSGGSRFIADYVASEVLAQQPEDVRRFLRATSVLDQMTGVLCDALTGGADGARRLAELASANLFLTGLDSEGAWYRYHALFAEVLRGALSPDEEAALRLRASAWYESQGMPDRAVRHALAAGRLSGDLSYAEALIGRSAEETARTGQPLAVRAWLEALPEDHVRAEGVLATIRAYILAMTGDLNGADDYSRAAYAALTHQARSDGASDSVVSQRLGKVWALRSFVALLKEQDDRAALRHSQQALAALPETEVSWRVLALWSRAEAFERLDRLSDAIEALREAQRTGRMMRETLFTIVAECGLIKLLNDHGRRREALALGKEAARRYSDVHGNPLPLSGLIYSHVGILHYEGGDLTQARRCHQQAEALGHRLGLDYELVYAEALAASTWFALGERQRAMEVVRAGYQHTSGGGYADAAWFLAWEANFALWSGDLLTARRWAQREALTPRDRPRLLRIEQHIAFARLLIAERRLADARHWLARLESFATEHGLYRWLVSVNVLQARVLDRLGDRPSALETMFRAVRTAASEGYVQPFICEGPRVFALVGRVRDVAPRFVDRVLAMAGTTEGLSAYLSPREPNQGLIEPLTARELEVLRLIAGGRSNREIAETLVIALGTVKRHTNHIYTKMGVHRRTEAVARARELGIL